MAKPFRRRPLPFPVRCLTGAWIHGVVAPMVYVFEGLGVTERVLRNAHADQQKRLVKKNPFKSYVPDEHDVIVATYAKSGTNWMMQIAHQLLFHGKGEFHHIHDVVPWPDSPPPLGKYAIPVEDPSVWMASPEEAGDQDAFELGADSLFGESALYCGDSRSQGCFSFQLFFCKGVGRGGDSST